MKRSTNKTIFIACLAACVALLFSSCSKKPGAAIVGKWHDDKDNTTTEFKSDGTMTLTGPDGSVLSGTYTFSDDTHFKANVSMAMPAEAKAQMPPGSPDKVEMNADCTVKITGDEMDLDANISVMGQPAQPDHSHLKRIK